MPDSPCSWMSHGVGEFFGRPFDNENSNTALTWTDSYGQNIFHVIARYVTP